VVVRRARSEDLLIWVALGSQLAEQACICSMVCVTG